MNKKLGLIQTPIFGVAIDQGSGLAASLQKARGTSSRCDDLLVFKRIVVEALSPRATALLVDAHYGAELLQSCDQNCTKMLAFEADINLINDDDRTTSLPDQLGPDQLRPNQLKIEDYKALGAQVVKYVMSYGPNDPSALNDKKQKIISDIGAKCQALNIPFLFEPMVYDRAFSDQSTIEYAELKPHLVTETMRIFSDPKFAIDMLKVDIPVNFEFVDGYGASVFSFNDALTAFRQTEMAADGLPFLYRSAGVPFHRFCDALQFAKMASVKSSGFMCGRALWSDAIELFGQEGPIATERWMLSHGRDRLTALIEATT